MVYRGIVSGKRLRVGECSFIGQRGGAAGSEVEASERAGTSGTRDEATGDDDGGDDRVKVRRRGGETSRQSGSVRRGDAAKGR